MIKLEDYVKTISGEGNEPTEEQTKLAKALFERKSTYAKKIQTRQLLQNRYNRVKQDRYVI